ncbi:MAG TPA: HDOD domain-containing protein [Polyangiaceae bacterium]|nr:HDOD domain-containing protein [Polyangiaceae bacterium]
MKVPALLDRIQEVCPLPATAQRVAQLAGDPKTRIDQIAAILATDPALTAEVMRIANSAAFGRSRQIAELEQAVLLIGAAQIHDMALAMGMLAAFRTKAELSFNFHDRAVVAGSIARSLAEKVGIADRSEMFVCGLLSEIGAMACAVVDATEYARVWQQASDYQKREELERARYEATSREIGGRLLRRNGLPESVARAIEADSTAPEAGTRERVTGFARRAAGAILEIGKTGDTAALAERVGALRDELGITLPAQDVVDTCLQAAGAALAALRQAR